MGRLITSLGNGKTKITVLCPYLKRLHRFAMAALAVNGVDRLAVNDLELTAPGPSFTAETLSRLRDKGLSPSQIFFITGADAFAEIETWRRYPEVLELAQFVVIARPGSPLESLPSRLPALAGRMTRGGRPPVPGTSAIFLVDVRTPDVSSTDIRRRIASGEPLAGLVPPAVEAHIVQHGLYGMPRARA